MIASKIVAAALVLLGCCSAANAPAKNKDPAQCTKEQVTSFCTMGPGGMDGQMGKSCSVNSYGMPYACVYKCLGGYKEFPGDLGSERLTKCVTLLADEASASTLALNTHTRSVRCFVAENALVCNKPSKQDYCDKEKGYVACKHGECQCSKDQIFDPNEGECVGKLTSSCASSKRCAAKYS
eukprot:17619-Heterococcus_DN1.PRE.2